MGITRLRCEVAHPLCGTGLHHPVERLGEQVAHQAAEPWVSAEGVLAAESFPPLLEGKPKMQIRKLMNVSNKVPGPGEPKVDNKFSVLLAPLLKSDHA